MNPADLFAPMPTHADDVWERLYAFATAWWRAPVSKDSVPSVELDAAERRLGIRLPVQVRNAYAFFGRYPEVMEGMIEWREPEDLWFDGDVLVLSEDEDDMGRWGILRADLATADPPVVARYPSLHPDRPWTPITERFTTYLVEHTLLQAVEESSPYKNWTALDHAIEPAADVRRIATSEGMRPVREVLYGGDDMLLLVRNVAPEVVVYVAARTAGAYERVSALVPGADWRVLPDEVHTPVYTEYVESLKETKALFRRLRERARKKKHGGAG